MSANSPHPIVYDPRSASDITAFLQQTATTSLEQREAKERVHRLFRIDETGPPPAPQLEPYCGAHTLNAVPSCHRAPAHRHLPSLTS